MTSTTTNVDDRTWPVLVILAYVAMVAMNALANALPLFGRNTGEVSGQFPSLFTPAPYTFSVWGLIYLALAGFAVFQVLARNRRATSPTARHLTYLRPLFVLSCLLNIGWLVAWHALQIVLSEVLMLGLLGTLITLYRRSGAWRPPATSGERWFVWAPLSLYLGWITVATVANTAITLLDLGFDGGTAAVAITVVVVGVAAVLGLLGSLRRRDGIYTLVVAWGLGGVAAARAGEVSVLVVVALVCVTVLVAVGLWALVNGSRATRTQPS
ncbi:MAG TPA: hypothetical protein VFN03_03300 [Trueperaceae bacterium]|nr:hypothetical protein [Trueperaceae bacterium]